MYLKTCINYKEDGPIGAVDTLIGWTLNTYLFPDPELFWGG